MPENDSGTSGGGLTYRDAGVAEGCRPARAGLIGAVTVPPPFAWLAEAGPIAGDALMRTFNCGIGLVAVAERAKADAVMTTFVDVGETVSIIGELVPRAEESAIRYSGRLDLGT